MTREQRHKIERLFVAIGRLEGKTMSLKAQLDRGTDQGTANVLARTELHLHNAWTEMTDAGLIR